MNANVGMIDRVLRVVIGLILIAYAIPLGLPQTGWNWIGWIGVVPLLTAFVGFCPALRLLGREHEIRQVSEQRNAHTNSFIERKQERSV